MPWLIKRFTEYEVTDDDRRKRVTSIEATLVCGRRRPLWTSLEHTDIYHAAMRNRALTVVSDAGLQGSGKGNQAIARLNMAGENSVAHGQFCCRDQGAME
jgi:hypothetical protein